MNETNNHSQLTHIPVALLDMNQKRALTAQGCPATRRLHSSSFLHTLIDQS